jgi:ketosteroid isomerase-like protein
VVIELDPCASIFEAICFEYRSSLASREVDTIQRHDSMSTGSHVVEAFLAGDAAAVADLLAPEAAFHSPVTDYHGRERVREVLAAVSEVVTDRTASSVLDAPGETVAFFSAVTQGRRSESCG